MRIAFSCQQFNTNYIKSNTHRTLDPGIFLTITAKLSSFTKEITVCIENTKLYKSIIIIGIILAVVIKMCISIGLSKLMSGTKE